MAKTKSFEIKVEGADEKENTMIKYWLLTPFVTSIDKTKSEVQIECFQKNSRELQEKVRVLVNNIQNLNPRILRLIDYFEKELKQDEWFFWAVDEDITQEEKDNILTYLISIDSDNKQKEQAYLANIKLQKLRKEYNICFYGENTHVRIGEPDKLKRICRYCSRSMPEVSFKKDAHTISEALGNKSIKTNDECDNCNQLFGDSIEQDFLSLFNISRVFFGIKNKTGYPHKVNGDNYSFKKTDNGNISINYYMKEGEQALNPDHSPLNISLISHRAFPEQNIYKALCKYVFGVLDDVTLKSFERTRKWLIGMNSETSLPKLARFDHPDVKKHPTIMVFIRKDESTKDLPHVVAEVRIINISFVVILPFSNKDIHNFCDNDNYDRFWKFFDIFSSVPGWQISDCSKLEPMHPIVKLNIAKRENDES